MAGKPKKKAAKKTRPSEPAPCAVLWGLGPSSEKGAAVRAILAELGVAARTVEPARLGDSVGALARQPGFRPAPLPYTGPAPVCEEFVLLAGLSEEQLDAFLARSREEGCSVGTKALLTRTNRPWPFVRLMEAVAAEHAATRG